MKIRLIGWESRGFRCPDGAVNLAHNDHVPRVSLIQMPNGTGKTTTLSLLSASLTGVASSWDEDRVAEFKRDGDASRSALFITRLSVDDKPLTFEMHFDFLNGRVRYKTSSPAGGGVEPGWNPPRTARRFLNERFVSLFVFDAELANKLLERTESKAEAAIDALCQLDLLDEVVAVAEASWKRATKDKGAKTSQGLTGLRNQESELEEQIKKVKGWEKKSAERLDTITARMKEIERAIGEKIAANDKVRERLEDLRLKEAASQSELDAALMGAFHLMRQPQKLEPRFAAALVALKTNLDRSRLPDSTSRQFFVELAQEPVCVCGRPIGTAERAHIQAEADKYLGEDISGVINALKQDIDTQVVFGDDLQAYQPALKALDDADTNFQTTATERQVEEAKAREELGPEVEVLRAEYDALKEESVNLKNNLEEIRRAPRATDDESSPCLSALKRLLVDVQKKIADATDTVELRLKTNILQELAKKAKQQARDHLKRLLVDESNQRLQHVLGADPIRIAEVKNSLVLSGQKKASVGQTLAVGYVFLATVLHRGTNEFPLVVDSPAGPLDHDVRREVGQMVPQLCNQFIAFTISTERDGFVPAVEKAAARDVQYLTLFRKTPGTASLLLDLPKKGVLQSSNGVLVEGRDYFNQFKIEKEAEA